MFTRAEVRLRRFSLNFQSRQATESAHSDVYRSRTEKGQEPTIGRGADPDGPWRSAGAITPTYYQRPVFRRSQPASSETYRCRGSGNGSTMPGSSAV